MSFNLRFNHLGMMVADRDEILHYYQSIGLGLSVGPQPLLPYEEGEGERKREAAERGRERESARESQRERESE